MPITDWPASERPRERLLQHGAHSLTEAELLAVFLRTGLPGATAVDLARQALDHFGGLNALLSAPKHALTAINGFGPAKYAQLQAVLELARRALSETLSQKPLLNTPEAVFDYLRLSLGNQAQEIFSVLFLNTQNRLISYEPMFQGTLTHTSVHPREIVKRALHLNCAAVILAHNHPSGSTQPSQADLQVTRALQSALNLVEVTVLDHIVVTRDHTLSFAQSGLLQAL